MKNISNILGQGNLTPHERYSLLVQNEINKAKMGKSILTLADEQALENWKAKTNEEAEEWNSFNDAWKHSGRVEIEAEFIFKDAQISYMAQLPILLNLSDYPIFHRMSRHIDMLENIKTVSIKQAIEIADKQRVAKLQEGMDFDYVVYRLAFESLTESEKKIMFELYPDIETDHRYLDQEEIIFNLFDGKEILNPGAKEKLATFVAERAYNNFAKEYQLYHYFACLSLLDVAKHFLSIKNIEIDEGKDVYDNVLKAITIYSRKVGVSVKDLLKESVLHWIDNGMFDDCRPLVISNQSDLLANWINKKDAAEKLLLKYVNEGVLKIKIVGSDDKRVISGESLYAWQTNYKFVQQFQQRVDEYEPNLGIVYDEKDLDRTGNNLDRELLICTLNSKGGLTALSPYGISVAILSGLADGLNLFEEKLIDGRERLSFKSDVYRKTFLDCCNSIIDKYSKMLALDILMKKLAKIFDADMDYHVQRRLSLIRDCLEHINKAIRLATNVDQAEESTTSLNILRRPNKLIFEDFPLIDIDNIKPDLEFAKEHEEKFRKILGKF